MLALWCFELPGGDPASTDIPAPLLCTLWVLGANPSLCFDFHPPLSLAGSTHQPGHLAFYVQKGNQDGISGNSLVVQYLRLHAFTSKGPGSIPDLGTKIPQAA